MGVSRQLSGDLRAYSLNTIFLAIFSLNTKNSLIFSLSLNKILSSLNFAFLQVELHIPQLTKTGLSPLSDFRDTWYTWNYRNITIYLNIAIIIGIWHAKYTVLPYFQILIPKLLGSVKFIHRDKCTLFCHFEMFSCTFPCI